MAMIENPTQEPLTMQLAKFAVELHTNDIPSATLTAARRALIDTVGCGLRGSVTHPAQSAMRALCDPTSSGGFLCFDGTKTQSAYQAAYVNGTAAHSIELDDTDAQGLTHPGVVVIPATLATAQSLPGTLWQDLLAAIAIGYDVAVRLARWVNPEHRMRGFHTTATITSLGAVAAVARLRRLPAEVCASAMGIALSNAAGSFEFITAGSNLKRLHAGKASASAIQACDLAESGIEGPMTALEGRYGFFRTSVSENLQPLDLSGLGINFLIKEVGTKRHACCRFCHTAIDVAVDLFNQGVRIDTSAEITVKVSSLCYSQTGDHRPMNELQRQFSTPYGVALALLTGTTKLSDYQEAPNREALRLAKHLILAVEESIPHDSRRASIKVRMHDTCHQHSLDTPYGESHSPFTDDEIRNKFFDLTQSIGSARELDAFYETLKNAPLDHTLEKLWEGITSSGIATISQH